VSVVRRENHERPEHDAQALFREKTAEDSAFMTRSKWARVPPAT
jgi:hypothetical protein